MEGPWGPIDWPGAWGYRPQVSSRRTRNSCSPCSQDTLFEMLSRTFVSHIPPHALRHVLPPLTRGPSFFPSFSCICRFSCYRLSSSAALVPVSARLRAVEYLVKFPEQAALGVVESLIAAHVRPLNPKDPRSSPLFFPRSASFPLVSFWQSPRVNRGRGFGFLE